MNESTRKDILTRLLSLRHVLIAKADSSRVDFFDELMEHHEFGLALDIICEHVLEQDALNISQSVVDEIETLHRTMEIDDRCVDELRRRKIGA